MADAARAARLADRIKVIVAKALERRVKDPRLGFVTITDARVTNDLQHATLYYTVFGSEEDAANTKKALESAKGILRAEVGKNITARLTPTLTFVADEVPENAFTLRRFCVRLASATPPWLLQLRVPSTLVRLTPTRRMSLPRVRTPKWRRSNLRARPA